MDFQTFKETLKKSGLTIKEFAKMCGLNPNSISGNWKREDKVPQWVKTWLQNYIKAKTLDNVKDVICSDESTTSDKA